MRHRRQQGFTLAEAAVAIVLLAVGVLALAGSGAMATRMIGRGRAATVAAVAAAARLEWLRQVAGSTSPRCAHPDFAGGAATVAGIEERWEVQAGARSRLVTLSLRYPDPRGARYDTLLSAVACE